MIYTISLEAIELRAAHGCYDTERIVGGNYSVDVTLTVEDSGGVEADDVTRTVNYVEVFETVRDEMATPSHIIEHAAHRIATAIIRRFPSVRQAEITIAKLAPPMGGKAARVSATVVAINPL